MNGVALAARLLLAGVFAAAGAAKLRDREGTRGTLEAFGLSAAVAAPGALLLPVAELSVAGLLLFDPTSVAGAIGALVLLGGFTVGITANLARGRRPDCNCFGQLQSKPIGPGTLARNAALAILALLVLAAGRTDAGAAALDDLGSLDTATGLAAAALALSALTLALVGWMGLHLLRQQGRVLLRMDAVDGGGQQTVAPVPPGLPIGAPAPAFELADVSGGRVTLRDLTGNGRPLALAFVDPDCGPCRSLLADLAGHPAGNGAGRLAIVITRADANAAAAMAEEHGLTGALLDPDGRIADAYGAEGTPMAVAIGPDSLIASETVAGPDAVRGLLDRLDDAGAGELVPDVELTDLEGMSTTLRAAAAGAPHLVLFWSPACGYCTEMLDDVRELEARDDLPPILVLATGDAEANRSQGLRSRTLLDNRTTGVADALGFRGTPSALRLDAEGRVASALAVGVDEVLALAGARREALPLVVHTPTSA